ncbi:ABC transporter F family member 5-like [Dendrobium catenatum]|uniref:ABC transporter F family member 5 n=1 Tax=Dendrobium catenatum TaxID=906689 RepID=A0A2I0VTF5_9ASPA|nr:ABC transporter F family member 5-like [Dendrobium catenatum]PKU66686.1 ABC transporter F family member 5 [Dendrobium catenatum]
MAGFSGIDVSFCPRTPAVAVETVETETDAVAEDIEFLLSESSTNKGSKKLVKKSSSGASSVSSGIKLENISKSFKGVTVLKDVSWEVKKGEKVGLVGVNGAGKTTQLRIIAGLDEPDAGNLVKAKENMKISFLSQEFEVCLNRVLKEEFLSAFKEEMEISERLEKVQKAMYVKYEAEKRRRDGVRGSGIFEVKFAFEW